MPKKPETKVEQKKAPAKKPVAKKAPASSIKKPKKALVKNFKPADWWDKASDVRKKSYVERHPKGEYARKFAKKFGIKYDAEKGLDVKAVRKVKVEGEAPTSRKRVPTLKNEVPGSLISVKEEKQEKPEPEHEKEHDTPKVDHDEVQAKLNPTTELSPERKKAIHRAMARKFTAHADKAIKLVRKEVTPQEEKHAEDGLKDLNEGGHVDDLAPKKKHSLLKLAKHIGMGLAVLAGAAAMFTPLAPLAMNLGAEYINSRFSEAADRHKNAEEALSAGREDVDLGDAPVTDAESMYHDMAAWLLQQDIPKLVEKLSNAK